LCPQRSCFIASAKHLDLFPSISMYADREEALRKSLMSDNNPAAMDPTERERYLQEELRRRAVDSRRREARDDPFPHEHAGSAYDDRRTSRRRGGDIGHVDDRSRWREDSSRDFTRQPYDDTPSPYRRRGGSGRRNDSTGGSYPRRRSRSPPWSRHGSGTSQPEYEQRSVFCSELDSHVAQRDLGEFFEEYLGHDTVLDVRVEVDPKTGLTKGIGYVELAREDLVPKAVELTGKRMFGAPIVVQRAEAAAKNYSVQLYEPPRSAGPSMPAPVSMSAPTGPILPPAHAIPGGPPASANPDARLYVGNLHFDIAAPHVRAVFEPFGQIDDVEVNFNYITGKNKGFAFVQFRRPEEAQQAIEQLNGFELAGRAMKVGLAGVRGGGTDISGSSDSQKEYSRDTMRQTDKRFALMEKLARTDPEKQARPSSIPEAVSSAILLKYMFNPAEETDPNWAADLREDVRDECARHGDVRLVYVDKDSADGEVYVCFADENQAHSARKSLEGRFFGGKQIQANFIPVAFAKAKAGW